MAWANSAGSRSLRLPATFTALAEQHQDGDALSVTTSIDGAVSSAMAVNRARAGGNAAVSSLYDDPEWESALAGFN